MIDDFRYGKKRKVVIRAVSNTKVSTLRNAPPCPGETVQSAFCLRLEMYLQKAGKHVLGFFPQGGRSSSRCCDLLPALTQTCSQNLKTLLKKRNF